jgi:hypothetical protein
VSAGSFLAACIRKSREELAKADITKAARDHQIPVEWAQFYIREELNRKGF